MKLNNQIQINFKDLLDNYNKVLTSTTRGFDTQYEFLEAWVPSDNTSSSIIDLFLVAKEYLIEELTLELDNITFIDLYQDNGFKTKIEKIGKVTFKNNFFTINFES